MQWDFKNATKIKWMGFCEVMLDCSRLSRRRKSMLGKAERSIEKELDLFKFIHRQRIMIYATLATLNGRQKYLAD